MSKPIYKVGDVIGAFGAIKLVDISPFGVLYLFKTGSHYLGFYQDELANLDMATSGSEGMAA